MTTSSSGHPPDKPSGELIDAYRALDAGPALFEHSSRSLLEIAGADRASWLHNLTTNDIKNLSPGEGQYAFVLNVQGRILFDLNILIRRDSIWVDLDGRWSLRAREHFEKYTIIEDVTVTDRSDEFARLALVGDAAKSLLAELGAPHAGSMPRFSMAEATFGEVTLPMFRDDFCGPFAVTLLVPVDRVKSLSLWLTDPARSRPAIPVGEDVVQIRRIEAGIPWPFHEITDESLPAETGQLERAVSFNKGCYLGQEVVERMRTRDVVARRLVGLQFEGEVPMDIGIGASLCDDGGKIVGTVTSVCRSVARDGYVGLGYVKTAASSVGTPLRAGSVEPFVPGVIAELPFVALAAH